MRPGWNPTRRNKHAGTKAHGHGNDNRMRIPEQWNAIYYEKLVSPVMVTRMLGDRELRFFVEPTRADCFYPCSIDDICHLLSHCPAEVLGAFDFIVLRQPTRKQRILSPAWGRAIFMFYMGQTRGAAIVIEAQSLASHRRNPSLTPEGRRELDRLQQDGHQICRSRQHITVTPSADSLRNTVLYRTLLHEIGHHVDYNNSTGQQWAGKTKSSKEDYAHRYAAELYASLAKHAHVPFAPLCDEATCARDGVLMNWFAPVTTVE